MTVFDTMQAHPAEKLGILVSYGAKTIFSDSGLNILWTVFGVISEHYLHSTFDIFLSRSLISVTLKSMGN